ncbi:hypothetical protein [Saccharibacillus kuerlensis]|uniref:Uncharacterized protein n=1 Tax=Saccharibacillus kuerlensis TaxID=459527 RepID=A0ABQ2L292_9BACL|nr:hypothetical protein [Saccharibacillus kuerlensis]GGO00210.1 hypothetical protein GCM10010969_21130 [Saccharibacillus kuerlensis]
MIEFKLTGKISAKIVFDDSGIEELITLFSEVLDSNEAWTRIAEDRILKVIRNEEASTMNLLQNNSITMTMDSDEIEYVIERLKICLVEKVFYPAEFCELRYKQKDVTIYAEYVEL